LFNDERELRFYRRYKSSNCQLECQANYSLASCECVMFSMPRTTETPVCAYNLHEHCAWSAVVHLVSIISAMDPEVFVIVPEEYENVCGCLPDCYSLLYDADLSQTKMRTSNFQDNRNKE
jgi:acid-sensing ion channel, other